MKNKDKKDFTKIIQTIPNIYKKTLGYELERIKVNEDGSSEHLHSDAFIDKHPERKNSPRFTDEEEINQMKLVAELASKY